MMMMIN